MLHLIPNRSLALSLIYACSWTLHATQAAAETMRFRDECIGNAVEGCYIVAEGKIDSETPERFQTFLKDEHLDGFKILLNSTGGSLTAGLELGRLIRAAGLQSLVGRWKAEGSFGDVVNDASCLSACAYSFLGGETRDLPKGNKIGFHQFFLSGQNDLFKTEAARSMAIAGSQKVSALLISYIVEMGVDARIFSRATEAARDEIFFPSREQLTEYELVTREGFAPFILEPYASGIIAASKRLDVPRAYDVVTQLTAYCKNGGARFLLSAPQHGLSTGMDFFDAGMRFLPDSLGSVLLSEKDVRIWSSPQSGFVELSFTADQIARLYAAEKVSVFLTTARAAGGTYSAVVTLGDMDKEMLKAAYRFCI